MFVKYRKTQLEILIWIIKKKGVCNVCFPKQCPIANKKDKPCAWYIYSDLDEAWETLENEHIERKNIQWRKWKVKKAKKLLL